MKNKRVFLTLQKNSGIKSPDLDNLRNDWELLVAIKTLLDKIERMGEMKYLYRCVDWYNEKDEPTILTQEFRIISETPCGFWIWIPGSARWVAKESKNGFARQTKKDAMKNYMIRKQYHVAHLTQGLAEAKRRLELALEEVNNDR